MAASVFSDTSSRSATVAAVTALGLDPAGVHEAGLHVTEAPRFSHRRARLYWV